MYNNNNNKYECVLINMINIYTNTIISTKQSAGRICNRSQLIKHLIWRSIERILKTCALSTTHGCNGIKSIFDNELNLNPNRLSMNKIHFQYIE